MDNEMDSLENGYISSLVKTEKRGLAWLLGREYFGSSKPKP